MKSTSAQPWWRQRRWQIALLLALGTTINTIDRQALSVAAPVILDEFDLTRQQYGWITSAFLATYALGQFLAGPVIDRLGTRRALSLAVSLWSVAAALHAFGRGFLSFAALRGLLGISEAANYPSAFKAIAEWFPKAERSLATGIVTSGSGLGSLLAPIVIGPLIYWVGWRATFVVTGLIGFAWLWAWRRAYWLPEQHPRISAAERALVIAERPALGDGSPQVPWYAFLRHRETWGLILARFAGDGGFYFFTFWLPTYLAQERGFSVLKVAAFAWIPFLAADFGTLGGGWLGTVLMRRGASLDRARKLVVWLGALCTLAVLPAGDVDSAFVAIALFAVGLFGIQVKTSSLFALPGDLFPARDVATAWGIAGALGSAGAMLFQPFVGWVADTWSYGPVFIIVPLLQIAAALAVSALVPRVERIDVKA